MLISLSNPQFTLIFIPRDILVVYAHNPLGNLEARLVRESYNDKSHGLVIQCRSSFDQGYLPAFSIAVRLFVLPAEGKQTRDSFALFLTPFRLI